MENYKTPEEINIQDKLIKIHSQFGTSEIATYKIQLLFDMYGKQQYNQGVLDAAEKIILFYGDKGLTNTGNTIKEQTLKLIKQ